MVADAKSQFTSEGGAETRAIKGHQRADYDKRDHRGGASAVRKEMASQGAKMVNDAKIVG